MVLGTQGAQDFFHDFALVNDGNNTRGVLAGLAAQRIHMPDAQDEIAQKGSVLTFDIVFMLQTGGPNPP